MAVEGRTRLPLHHLQRQSGRNFKLWKKDEDRASRRRRTRIPCPCNICWPIQTPLLRETVYVHYRRYARHPRARGHTEGDPYDSSDEEWDNHLRHAPDFGAQEFQPMDKDVPVQDMVADAFGVADNIADHAAHAEVRRNRNQEDEVWEAAMRDYAELVGEFDHPVYNSGSDEATNPPNGNAEVENHAMREDYYDPDIDVERIRLEEAARIPLYGGSTVSSLPATLILMNALRNSAVPNVCMTEV